MAFQRQNTLNNVWDVNTLTWVRMQQPTLEADSVIVELPNEGQQTMANSISVAIASDQSAVPVSATNLDIRDLVFATDKVDASGTILGAGTNNIGDVDVASIPAAVISTLNSTTTPLGGGGGEFTGTYEDVSAYQSVAVLSVADTVMGFNLQWSNDGTNTAHTQNCVVSRSSAAFRVAICGRYVRLNITNGGAAQSTMNTKTMFFHGVASSNESVDLSPESATALTTGRTVPLMGAVGFMRNPSTGRVEGLKSSDTGSNLRVQLNDGALGFGVESNIGGGSRALAVFPFRYQTGTVTSVNDSASSVTILTGNTGRKFALIFNDSTENLYLKYGVTASLTDFTVKVGPQALFEVHEGYVGRIDGIWAANGAGAARVTECTL